MFEYKEDDILKADEQYICHQCNCRSITSAGLALHIFKELPYANIYNERKTSNSPDLRKAGHIVIRGDGITKRFVINMLAQVYPGASQGYDLDSNIAREKYFKQCLDEISQIPNLTSIAFPYKIGCGLAGGDWGKYEKMLKDFSESTTAKVTVYIPPGATP